MSELESLKKSRKEEKRKVTLTIKKLKGCLQRGVDDSELVSLSKSLEDNFYDLNDLHLQVLEFEDSEEDYLLEIEQEFNDAKQYNDL